MQNFSEIKKRDLIREFIYNTEYILTCVWNMGSNAKITVSVIKLFQLDIPSNSLFIPSFFLLSFKLYCLFLSMPFIFQPLDHLFFH